MPYISVVLFGTREKSTQLLTKNDIPLGGDTDLYTFVYYKDV